MATSLAPWGTKQASTSTDGDRRRAPVLAATLGRAFRVIGGAVGAVLLVGTGVGAVLGSVAVAVPVGCLLALAMVGLLARQHRRLGREVVAPVDDLVRTSELLEQGFRVDPLLQGPQEIERVAMGLRRITERLDQTRTLLRERDEQLDASYQLLRYRDEQLAAYDADVQNLVRMARLISGNYDLPFLLRTVSVAALEATRLSRAVIWLMDRGRLVASYDSAAPDALAPALPPVALGVGRVGAAAQTHSLAVEPREGTNLAPSPGAAVPMEAGGRVVGVVEVLGEELEDLSPQQQWMLEILAAHAGVAVEAARLQTRNELLLRHDPGTGLGNYRQFVADLTMEMERAKRYGRPLALVMADIDRFGRFNELRGRQRGDEVLALFGSLFATRARASDTAYRFADDEFLVVVRDVDEAAACVLAERLREEAKRVLRTKLPEVRLTLSFGVADLASASDGEALLDRVHEALARAQAEGGDQVVGWQAVLAPGAPALQSRGPSAPPGGAVEVAVADRRAAAGPGS